MATSVELAFAKDQIIRKVRDGQWTFSLLMPLYIRAVHLRLKQRVPGLVAGLELSKLGIDICTAAAFGYITLPSQLTSYQKQSDDDDDLFYKIAQAVKTGTRIKKLEEVEAVKFQQAELILRRYSSLHMDFLSPFIRIIRLSGHQFRGASHPHFMQVYFMGDGFAELTETEAAVSLVHEMGHQELFLINTVDRLVRPGADLNLSFAPFQGVDRPPIGRLHSCFALFRMIVHGREFGLPMAKELESFTESRTSFKDGELTDFASLLISACSEKLCV